MLQSLQKCWCHDVNDGEHLQELRELLEKYVSEATDDQLVELTSLREKSQIKSDPKIANKEGMPNHIDYDLDNADASSDLLSFKQLVQKELKLRLSKEEHKTMMKNKPVLEDQVSELADRLIYEQKVWDAKETLDRQKLVKWMLAEQAIPCTLHMKMRVVEVLRDNLFQQCITERYQEGKDDSAKKNLCMEAITDYMNDVVYGDKDNGYSGQWKFPMEKGVIVKQGMTGNTASKAMESLVAVAEIVYSPKFDESTKDKRAKVAARKSNSDKLRKWRTMMQHFNRYWKILDKTDRDLTDTEIGKAHRFGNRSCFLDITWICSLKVSPITFI